MTTEPALDLDAEIAAAERRLSELKRLRKSVRLSARMRCANQGLQTGPRRLRPFSRIVVRGLLAR